MRESATGIVDGTDIVDDAVVGEAAIDIVGEGTKNGDGTISNGGGTTVTVADGTGIVDEGAGTSVNDAGVVDPAIVVVNDSACARIDVDRARVEVENNA